MSILYIQCRLNDLPVHAPYVFIFVFFSFLSLSLHPIINYLAYVTKLEIQ